MDFLIKSYKVPTFKDEEGKVNFKEVKLDKENLISVEEIDIDESFKIPIEANNIAKFNSTQLRLGGEFAIKKILCRKPEIFIK